MIAERKGDYLEIKDAINQAKLKKIKANSIEHYQSKNHQKQQKGSFLKQRRVHLRLSLSQLSQLTQIDQVTLQRWETHGMTPDDKISQIRKYAKIMHLNLSSLVNQIVG